MKGSGGHTHGDGTRVAPGRWVHIRCHRDCTRATCDPVNQRHPNSFSEKTQSRGIAGTTCHSHFRPSAPLCGVWVPRPRNIRDVQQNKETQGTDRLLTTMGHSLSWVMSMNRAWAMAGTRGRRQGCTKDPTGSPPYRYTSLPSSWLLYALMASAKHDGTTDASSLRSGRRSGSLRHRLPKGDRGKAIRRGAALDSQTDVREPK